MRHIYYDVGRPLAAGEIEDLPGSSQVAVFHSAFVTPAARKQHVGTIAHQERLLMAGTLMYDYAICTVVRDNEAEIKILERYGWNRLSEFYSQKTGHNVCLYGKKIER